MGKVHAEGVDGRLRAFIDAQPLFFVATAPLAADGHINLSPKGHAGCFAVLGAWTVAYLDWTGSGAETIAHLRENGRITIMFAAFQGPPNIVRLHGRAEAVPVGDPRFDELLTHFPNAGGTQGVRSVVRVDVTRVSDSCGWSVPLMEYVGERTLLRDWAERRTDAELADYRARRNPVSIDGLPAVTTGPAPAGPATTG
jgi:hypothetical protein